MDPCEKEPTDALDNMVPQGREEITVDAQVTNVFISSMNEDGNNEVQGGRGSLLNDNHQRQQEERRQLQLRPRFLPGSIFGQNASSHIKALFSSSSICSKLCGGSPSDRSTRSLAWSLCRHPSPTLATANGGWTAATLVKERGRARRTKRKKQTPLDRCFNLLC